MSEVQVAHVYEVDGQRFIPSELAAGFWDRDHQAGGAAGALLAHAMERFEPGWSEAGGELLLARATIEMLRPVPMKPLTVLVEPVVLGRRTHRLSASLRCDDVEVGRATGLRVAAVPLDLPAGAEPRRHPPPPGPEAPWEPFDVGEMPWTSFLDACEVRVVEGNPDGIGPCTFWCRPTVDFLAGVGATPLAVTVAMADYSAGMGGVLRKEDYLRLSADLNVHLHRYPVGPWLGIEGLMTASDRGRALGHGALHDEAGSIGHATASLVVSRR